MGVSIWLMLGTGVVSFVPSGHFQAARSLADTRISPSLFGQAPVVILRCSQTRSRATRSPGDGFSPARGTMLMLSFICPIGSP